MQNISQNTAGQNASTSPKKTTEQEVAAMKAVGSRNQSVTGLDSKSHDLAFG